MRADWREGSGFPCILFSWVKTAKRMRSIEVRSLPRRRRRRARSLRRSLAAHHRQLQEWAENCPENFENRAALVGAEVARLAGHKFDAERLYEKAIQSARANGFVDEVIASEVAARFYAAHGLETNAQAHLRNARQGPDKPVTMHRRKEELRLHIAEPEIRRDGGRELGLGDDRSDPAWRPGMWGRPHRQHRRQRHLKRRRVDSGCGGEERRDGPVPVSGRQSDFADTARFHARREVGVRCGQPLRLPQIGRSSPGLGSFRYPARVQAPGWTAFRRRRARRRCRDDLGRPWPQTQDCC